MPHMATTAGDEQTVEYMLKRWQDSETGLDQAWREEYMVYLSFPDPKNPNKVTVGESTRWWWNNRHTRTQTQVNFYIKDVDACLILDFFLDSKLISKKSEPHRKSLIYFDNVFVVRDTGEVLNNEPMA